MRDLNQITLAYLQAMLWVDLRDESGESLDGYGVSDCSPILFKEAEGTCARFLVDIAMAGVDASAWNDAQLGHDIWLTRNRHGAGFWDRGHGEAGAALTKIAHSYGERYPYVGDDGKVHTD